MAALPVAVFLCLCLCLTAGGDSSVHTAAAIRLRGGGLSPWAALLRRLSPSFIAGESNQERTDAASAGLRASVTARLKAGMAAVTSAVSAAVSPCFGKSVAGRHALRSADPEQLSQTSPRAGIRQCDSLDSYAFEREVGGGTSGLQGSVVYSHNAAGVPVGLHHSKESNLPAFEVLLDCLPSGAPPDRVQVVLHRKYCRTRRNDIEKGIDSEWKRLTERESRMWWYDGTLFRLASSQRWLDMDGTQEVKLECGITRYRSFLGTNMASNWDLIPHQHMSNPLSCFVLVHTSDRYIMLVSRQEEDTAAFSYVLPGGHLRSEKNFSAVSRSLFKVSFNLVRRF